jgi:hypothetical protein
MPSWRFGPERATQRRKHGSAPALGPRLPTGRTSYSGGVASGTSVSRSGADRRFSLTLVRAPRSCMAGEARWSPGPGSGYPDRASRLSRASGYAHCRRVRRPSGSSPLRSSLCIYRGCCAGPDSVAAKSMRMTMRLRRRGSAIRRPGAVPFEADGVPRPRAPPDRPDPRSRTRRFRARCGCRHERSRPRGGPTGQRNNRCRPRFSRA